VLAKAEKAKAKGVMTDRAHLAKVELEILNRRPENAKAKVPIVVVAVLVEREAKKGEHGGYDRRSGTGRGRDVSKDGAGVGNWGKPGEGTEPEAIEETQAELAAEAEEAVPREPTEEELARIKEREEEEKQMTMEEYMAAQALKKPVQEKKELRKVEDVDQKNVLRYNEDDDNYFVGGGTDKKKKNKGKKAKEIMAVEFAAPKREQVDDREERGKGKGGKGGKGKGKGDFGGSPVAAKPRVKQGPAPVMDENSFPSL